MARFAGGCARDRDRSARSAYDRLDPRAARTARHGQNTDTVRPVLRARHLDRLAVGAEHLASGVLALHDGVDLRRGGLKSGRLEILRRFTAANGPCPSQINLWE